MPDYIDDPPDVLAALRTICLGLPEAYGGAGLGRYPLADPPADVRARAHRRGRVARAVTRLQFRASEPEFEVLLAVGHPFVRAGWGTNVVNMTLDADTDWTEVAELLAESYCVLAPKRLAARVHA